MFRNPDENETTEGQAGATEAAAQSGGDDDSGATTAAPVTQADGE
jgi:hypothetical protein